MPPKLSFGGLKNLFFLGRGHSPLPRPLPAPHHLSVSPPPSEILNTPKKNGPVQASTRHSVLLVEPVWPARVRFFRPGPARPGPFNSGPARPGPARCRSRKIMPSPARPVSSWARPGPLPSWQKKNSFKNNKETQNKTHTCFPAMTNSK